MSTFPATVVVGRIDWLDTKDAPHVIACGEPSSLILIISLSKLLGAPERLVLMVLIAAARAVIVTASQVSVLIVGVAELVIVVTRGMMRVVILPKSVESIR